MNSEVYDVKLQHVFLTFSSAKNVNIGLENKKTFCGNRTSISC